MDSNDDQVYSFESRGSPASTSTPPPRQQQQHMEFLDLTNGAGGEAPTNDLGGIVNAGTAGATYRAAATPSGVGGDYDSADHALVTDPTLAASATMMTVADPMAGGGGAHAFSHLQHLDGAAAPLPSSVTRAPGGGVTMSVPLLPATASNGDGGGGGGGGEKLLGGGPGAYFDPSTPGRVVETGQEHTGRWTKEEHEAFLSGLKQYGKEWKKVAAKVKTRTVVQTRTHAQKYFQKIAKATEGREVDDDGMPVVEMGTASEAGKASESAQKRKTRLAVTTTATLTPLPPAVVGPAVQRASRTASVSNAAQVISNLSGHSVSNNSLPGGSVVGPSEQVLSHGFQTASTAGYAQPVHGFSATSLNHGGTAPKVPPGSTIGTSAFPMKIVAPEPDSATKRGKFPEPSPAACGKRKLAEIAAARMLAGVAASGVKAPRPLENNNIASSSPAAAFSSTTGTQAGMAPLDNIEDGTATPPPEMEQTMGRSNQVPSMPPAAVFASGQQPRKPGLGLSLQIVNPASLGVSHEEVEKKRKDGNASPVTPWEGQLQALVSEEKRKVPTPLEASLAIPKAPDIGGFGGGVVAKAPILGGILHHICGPGSAFGRSSLHKAVCDMDLAAIQSQITHQSGEYMDRRDQKGYCPTHSACALCMKDPINSSMATEIVRILIAAGADASMRDFDGNTPLHWAARAGDKGTAEFLLLKNNPKDAKNERGETPLHWAMRAGRVGIPVASVLLENGARPAVWSMDFKRPIDVAADGYSDEPDSVLNIRLLADKRKKLSKQQRQKLREATEERKEARANLFECSPQSRSLVLHHPECLEHIPKAESDWENPGRVLSIMERIQGTNIKPGTPCIHPWEIQISQEFERAKLDLLSRVHSTDYLNFVNELSKDLERQQKKKNGNDEEDEYGSTPPVVPFTPMVQRTMIKVQESSVKLGQHSDTSFSAGSLRAARRAAGAVQHAVDCVLIGRQRNAFCVVRPPGHHAGINGLLEGGESCGFCIFNSVAAGALHAISDERLLCERCAIVDLDVHHGNGTEEIVRKCHDPGKLFFFSIHLYDNERKGKRETKSFQYKFYPGTGDEDDLPLNIINVPVAPLWKEQEQLQQQVATGGGNHNTRHRTRNRANLSDDGGDSSEAGTPRVSDAEVDNTKTLTGSSSPSPSTAGATGGRVAYRKSIQDRLLPALRAFNPDLILISAGFDACKDDVGNAKHEIGGKQRSGMDLEPEDYAWATRKILEIADICCQGRVVSVLEGGYGRHPTTGPYDPTQPLDKSLFSECAVRHMHAMIDPYNVEARFPGSKADCH